MIGYLNLWGFARTWETIRSRIYGRRVITFFGNDYLANLCEISEPVNKYGNLTSSKMNYVRYKAEQNKPIKSHVCAHEKKRHIFTTGRTMVNSKSFHDRVLLRIIQVKIQITTRYCNILCCFLPIRIWSLCGGFERFEWCARYSIRLVLLSSYLQQLLCFPWYRLDSMFSLIWKFLVCFFFSTICHILTSLCINARYIQIPLNSKQNLTDKWL